MGKDVPGSLFAMLGMDVQARLAVLLRLNVLDRWHDSRSRPILEEPQEQLKE